MPKLTVDGREIEAAAGTTVLQAVLARGGKVPHYCYHPALSISGNCRMCLVEVEKSPKLLIACATQVAEGMVVRTETERVTKARAAMMEFFLINHPLDCPICDQAGECRLQEYAAEHGTGRSRFVEEKLELNKAVDLGPHVILDQERCIQCSRCVRFCEEVPKTGELAFFGRGERTVIGVFPGKPLDNPYSGNVVDICPVGALTLKEFRFQTRVWYLRNTPSICVACSRGCNVLVATGQQQAMWTTTGQQDDRIKRLVPRVNPEVNGHWICDEGRLSYRLLETARRLDTAEAPAGSAAPWDAAVSLAARLLKSSAAAGRLAAIVSPRLVSEDLFGWRTVLESLGGARIGVRSIVRGADDDLLIRADRGGNSAGASRILGSAATEASVLEAASRGEIETLLVVGDPLDPADTAAPDPALCSRIAHIVFVGPFVSGAAERAEVLIPSTSWGEEDGTVVNFEGRVQRVRRAHLHRGDGRPGWRIALHLAAAAGAAAPSWGSVDDALADLGRSVQAFEGLDAHAIGLLGARERERASKGDEP